MVTRSAPVSSSSFVSFRLRPAGPSSITISGSSPYSGQSPTTLVTKPGYRLTVGMFNKPCAHPGSGRAIALGATERGGFQQAGERPSFSVADVPPAGFQSPSFHGTDVVLESAHHAHGGCCPVNPSSADRSKMVPPVGYRIGQAVEDRGFRTVRAD